ncbi:MAG TPA: sigma 54-interacting transcriptional regulator, partial [Oscillospiraceae bacterium]|nr:sigma 54-interacting transcriptional regulator [Oscillospiraceae bacterium]
LESELFGYERGAFTGAAACGKKGLLEVADGSTLFLDEIGDMSLASQAKLLRVLEQKQFYRLGGQKPVRVDVRIVAATNVPLEAMVQQKKFREDLYYRLNVVPILLRPLREREDDILLLAECFLMEHIPPDAPDGRWEMTDEVSELLENYAWPGNIRELRNAVGYMAAMARSGVLSRDCLPEHLLRCARAQAQKGPTAEEIRAALDAFGRSTEGKKRAAEHLGMSLPTLYRMIKKLGVT